jgi:histidyl-tRNA synthetase
MSKTKVPAAGALLVLKDKKLPAQVPVARAPQESPVYLVQLGFGPKVKTLLLIDELRRAGVAVRQNVLSDSLSEQLRHAESTNARYAVILGHKEYMDGTVIIRDLHQQNQENLPVSNLASYLRKVAA